MTGATDRGTATDDDEIWVRLPLGNEREDWRRAPFRPGLVRDNLVREMDQNDITISEEPSERADTSVLPGEIASEGNIRRSMHLRALKSLVNRFVNYGWPVENGDSLRPTQQTADACKAILDLLPAEAELPRIAPDEEGAMLMVWETVHAVNIVIVDGWTIHAVSNAGTPNSQHHVDLPFERMAVSELLFDLAR